VRPQAARWVSKGKNRHRVPFIAWINTCLRVLEFSIELFQAQFSELWVSRERGSWNTVSSQMAVFVLDDSCYHHGVWNLPQWASTECPEWVVSCELVYFLCYCYYRMHHDPVSLRTSKSTPRSRPFKTKSSAISAVLVPLDWKWIFVPMESCQLLHGDTVCISNFTLFLAVANDGS
jgi:hypothetical protein